ncbi:MAG: OmpH family outer membrane protein [Planctomycetota bacterium]|nr:MAG: OmpH family outer membrane protein [Planctomycetota bacterium]RLS98967.1 MAG: OmpH family outer membrane protein [Planctomycetota bacterium]
MVGRSRCLNTYENIELSLNPLGSEGVRLVKRYALVFAMAVMAAPSSGFLFAQAPAQGPGRQQAQPQSSGVAVHAAVLDVGYVFKNHIRFKGAMDKMKDEVMAAENGLKAERDRITTMMEQLKGYNVGTPEYKKLEAEVAKAQGDFNVNTQLQKKDFMEKEAQSYLQVYTEIEKAVAQFAREHQIAVVHRFEGDPIDTTDRNNILRGITKPILYVDPSIDITPDITKMLNASAVADQSGRASPAGQQRRTQ